ncbi:MAG: helix-turn-helix transcriptional regulator [Clostridiales bacterium]|nr:helix-turn-helix transcriptional regulator [Clostridiales bacterium]
MDSRIKHLRCTLGLTQEQFAARIGIKRGAVANYEIGRNVPTDSVVSLIVREFGVSEEWLRYGDGEMYIRRTADQELELLVNSLMSERDSSFRKQFVSLLLKIPPDRWIEIQHFCEQLVGASEEQSEAARRAALHAELDRRLDEEKRARERSGA